MFITKEYETDIVLLKKISLCHYNRISWVVVGFCLFFWFLLLGMAPGSEYLVPGVNHMVLECSARE